MNNKKIILSVLAILAVLLAWWFRYDTHCTSENRLNCVAYDRWTGNWLNPTYLAFNYHNKDKKEEFDKVAGVIIGKSSWKEVAENPRYQSASPEVRDQIKEAFFDIYVSPKIPAGVSPIGVRLEFMIRAKERDEFLSKKK